MPALPEFRKKAIEAIGEVLSEEDIVKWVRAATGNDIFNVYCGRNDPRAIQLSKTLDQLEIEGTERWLLTYIMIAIAREKIRKLIVKTWPKTLVGLPQAEEQVGSALKYLDALLKLPLSRDLRHELKPKQDAFEDIRQRIAALYAYKNLHEDLHQLSLKLTWRAGAIGGGRGAGFRRHRQSMRKDACRRADPHAAARRAIRRRQNRTGVDFAAAGDHDVASRGDGGN